MRPREDQVEWLKNGKPKERVAIYLDTFYMLWDDGSIRPITYPSLGKEGLDYLKKTIELHRIRVSIVDSPNATEILEPLIESSRREMQERLKMLTKDVLLEMNMKVCSIDGELFESLLKKLS